MKKSALFIAAGLAGLMIAAVFVQGHDFESVINGTARFKIQTTPDTNLIMLLGSVVFLMSVAGLSVPAGLFREIKPSVVFAVGICLACMFFSPVANSLISRAFPSQTYRVIAAGIVSPVLAFWLPGILIVKFHLKNRERPDFNFFWLLAVLPLVVLVFVMVVYEAYLGQLSFHSGVRSMQIQTLMTSLAPEITLASIIRLYLLLALMPAVFEEFFFRGVFYEVLEEAGANAIFYSSLFFAGAHNSVTQFLVFFTIGVACAWLRKKSGRLAPSILLHFLINAVTITAFIHM